MENEEKKITPVVKGTVTRTKRTKRKVFVEEDLPIIVEDVKDRAVPAILDGIFDVCKIVLERLIYRDFDSDRSSDGYYRRGSSSSRVQNYNSMYRSPVSYNHSREARGVRSRYDVDEIAFDRESDASRVLDILSEEIAEYGHVTVGSYYSACEISPTAGDFNYGWYELRNAKVQYRRGKWVISMPRCVAIEK